MSHPQTPPQPDDQPSHSQPANRPRGWRAYLRRHWHKLVAAGLWLTLLAGYGLYARAQALSPLGAAQALTTLMAGSGYGALIYVVVYALTPVLFFPTTLLTLAGGFVFGPVWGFVLTTVGANASSLVSYGMGRWLGQAVFNPDDAGGRLQRYTARLRANSFETVLVMRLVFLPYELVGYLCGFLQINWRAFLLATFLGGIPGTIAFVSFGASIQGQLTDLSPRLSLPTLGLAVGMLLISLALSRFFRRRENHSTSETLS